MSNDKSELLTSGEPPPEQGNPLVVLSWFVLAFVGLLTYGYFSH